MVSKMCAGNTDADADADATGWAGQAKDQTLQAGRTHRQALMSSPMILLKPLSI